MSSEDQVKSAWDYVLRTVFQVYADPNQVNIQNAMNSMFAFSATKKGFTGAQVHVPQPLPQTFPKVHVDPVGSVQVQATPAVDSVPDGAIVLHEPGDVDKFKSIYMHIITDRELSDHEILQASGCLGYALRECLRGDQLSDPEVVQKFDSPVHSELVIKYDYDTDSSQRSDPKAHYLEAFNLAKKYIFEGTPVRKTDQQGYGTRGTRLVDGLGNIAPNGNDAALVSFMVAV